MRDIKSRFKSKELLLPLPSTTMVINVLFLIFIILLWLYMGLKFNMTEKINTLLNSLFFDYSKCDCSNSNGENKNKTNLNNNLINNSLVKYY